MKNDFLYLVVCAGKLIGLESWIEALITTGNMKWIGEVFDEKFHRITEGISWESFQ
jgi:hypothetical protein